MLLGFSQADDGKVSAAPDGEPECAEGVEGWGYR
jgi:hypothetical protein